MGFGGFGGLHRLLQLKLPTRAGHWWHLPRSWRSGHLLENMTRLFLCIHIYTLWCLVVWCDVVSPAFVALWASYPPRHCTCEDLLFGPSTKNPSLDLQTIFLICEVFTKPHLSSLDLQLTTSNGMWGSQELRFWVLGEPRRTTLRFLIPPQTVHSPLSSQHVSFFFYLSSRDFICYASGVGFSHHGLQENKREVHNKCKSSGAKICT